jgi:hypothetical protein
MSPSPAECSRSDAALEPATCNRVEVPAMRKNICGKPGGISSQIETSVILLDISSANLLTISLVYVVLRTDVRKAERDWRDARDEVIPMRNPVVSSGLVGDVIAELRASNPR